MTRPRSLAYRSLEVHRLEAPPSPRRRDEMSRAFAIALNRWRATAAMPSDETAGAEDTPAALPRQGDAQGEDGTGYGSSSERHEHDEAPKAEPAPLEREAAEWVRSLVPTAGTLQFVLDRVGPSPMPLEVVADVVARFCNEHAVDHSEGWSVRMPLRADVLPDTTLELTLSTHALHLRFVTGSAQARSHIASDQQRLHDRLAQLLCRRRDISIDIA